MVLLSIVIYFSKGDHSVGVTLYVHSSSVEISKVVNMILAALSLGVAEEQEGLEGQEGQNTILNDILQRRFLHFGRDGHGTGRRIKCSVHRLIYIFKAYRGEVLSSLQQLPKPCGID